MMHARFPAGMPRVLACALIFAATSFALKELTAVDDARLAALVQNAVG